MPDEVECGECGHRYDSDDTPFCPRCGSTQQGEALPGAIPAAARRHPLRRRVQAGGVVLIAASAPLLVLFALALVVPDPSASSAFLFEGQTGGDVAVRTVRGDAPVPNASVAFLHPSNGTVFANGTTDARGWFNASAGPSAVLVVQVREGNATWNRTVLAIDGAERLVRMPLHAAPGELEPMILTDAELLQMRVLAGFLTAFLALGVAGGVAAIRLRPRPIAVAGALAALVPPFVIVFVVPLVGLIPVLLVGVGAGLVLSGRRVMR